MNPEDAFKFYYVFKGPKKDQSKKLYYVYGTNMNSKDVGIKHEMYKPQGKGYNWPESFRKANNLYYELIFLEQGGVYFNLIFDIHLLWIRGQMWISGLVTDLHNDIIK